MVIPLPALRACLGSVVCLTGRFACFTTGRGGLYHVLCVLFFLFICFSFFYPVGRLLRSFLLFGFGFGLYSALRFLAVGFALMSFRIWAKYFAYLLL